MIFYAALDFTLMIVMGIIMAISIYEKSNKNWIAILAFFGSTYLFFDSILSLIK